MNLKSCEKKEKSIAEIIIEISPEEFQAEINKVFIKNRNRILVPGFRKGKAPRKIIEKMYGVSVFQNDALETLLPEALNYAISESGLKLIEQPKITDIDIKDDGGGVDVMITAAVYPDIILGEYKGLSARKPSADVLESEIDENVEATRNRNARIEKTDRPAMDGDIVSIDFKGFVDGEPFKGGERKNYELTIGSRSLIPGFEEKLIGMSADEKRVLDLVFPASYEEHLAGKPVVFEVTLNEVKEKILPELDDEFAKDVSEFDTLEEYRASIRAEMENARQVEADDAFEEALLDLIVDGAQVDVPDIMVEKQMDKAVSNAKKQIAAYGIEFDDYMKMMETTPEAFRETTRALGLKQVTIALALEKIAELEGIEASREEIDDEYAKASVSMDKEIDELKETVSEESVVGEIKIRLASKFVIDNAIVDNSDIPEETAAPVDIPEETVAPIDDLGEIVAEIDEPEETATSTDIPEETATAKKKPSRKLVAKKSKGEEEE